MFQLYINDVLSPVRQTIFTKLAAFKRKGVLAGGTALALQLKHRRSFDFDIFTSEEIPTELAWEVKKVFGKTKIIRESGVELTFLTARKIKITFFHYPFKSLYKIIKTNSLSIFDWRDVAADKAYTVGRRPIYRDYVDIFFIIRNGYTLKNIIRDAQQKFKGLFSEKLFLGQLTYFTDLKLPEIEFLGEKYTPGEIKSFFEKVVKEYINSKIK